jgi:hypothetical protein
MQHGEGLITPNYWNSARSMQRTYNVHNAFASDRLHASLYPAKAPTNPASYLRKYLISPFSRRGWWLWQVYCRGTGISLRANGS